MRISDWSSDVCSSDLVDGDGRTVGVTDVTGTTTFEYDDAGQLVRIVLPDGVTTERTYDGRGRVTRILSASATETVLDLTMTYDATGGVATEAEAVAGTTTAYGYDAVRSEERRVGKEGVSTGK